MTVVELRDNLNKIIEMGRGNEDIAPVDCEHNSYYFEDSEKWFADYDALFVECDGFIGIRFV
jgi:uncharacterized protein VirK/YbjX